MGINTLLPQILRLPQISAEQQTESEVTPVPQFQFSDPFAVIASNANNTNSIPFQPSNSTNTDQTWQNNGANPVTNSSVNSTSERKASTEEMDRAHAINATPAVVGESRCYDATCHYADAAGAIPGYTRNPENFPKELNQKARKEHAKMLKDLWNSGELKVGDHVWTARSEYIGDKNNYVDSDPDPNSMDLNSKPHHFIVTADKDGNLAFRDNTNGGELLSFNDMMALLDEYTGTSIKGIFRPHYPSSTDNIA